MSDLSVNQPIVKQDLKQENVETGGVIANNTPKLFAPAPATETGGVVASNSSSSSSGSVNFTC